MLQFLTTLAKTVGILGLLLQPKLSNLFVLRSVRHGREPYKHTPTYDVFEPRQVKYDEIFHVPHDSRSQQALSIEFWYEGSVMKMFGEETS